MNNSMDWIANIDWEKLKEPNGYFHPFRPEDDEIEFYKKVVKFKKMLHDRYLWVSDEYRSMGAIDYIVNSYFSGTECTVVYEVGDFQGVLAFVNIIPEFKAEVMFKIWDKDLWKKSFVRAGREILDLYMKEFRLKRLGTSTADPKMEKFCHMFGFDSEGYHPYSFRWRGKYYDKIVLGRYGETDG